MTDNVRGLQVDNVFKERSNVQASGGIECVEIERDTADTSLANDDRIELPVTYFS